MLRVFTVGNSIQSLPKQQGYAPVIQARTPLLFFLLTATTTAVSRAVPSVRAADTFFAAFFGFPNRPACKSQDTCDHSDNNNIHRIHSITSFR